MHHDQLPVDAGLVARLVADQFPAWAGWPVTEVRGGGTVNAIFRIGDELAARLPLRPDRPDRVRAALRAEQQAARRLVGRTTVPVPAPVALGEPGPGYPLPWSVQRWLPGHPATPDVPGTGPGADRFARELARFVREVRGVDTGGVTFADRGLSGARGGVLADHDGWVQECLERSVPLAGAVDVAGARALWADCRDLPRRKPDVTSHGDLIPANLLTGTPGSPAQGRLTGVLDVGGTGPADPALDLVAGWHLLDAAARRTFRAALGDDAVGCDDLDWERGRGWALEQALGLVWYYVDTNPPMAALGRSTIARLLAG